MPAPIRKAIRKKDCKYYVERGLEKLGYRVNSFTQEQLPKNECVVLYTDFKFNVDTTESYYGDIYITINFNVDDNLELPYAIIEIIANVTQYLEESGAPWCTSFRFLKPRITNSGNTSYVELPAVYSMEVDWVD